MWIYEGKEFSEAPADKFGFVYLIADIKTGKRYIGQKRFRFTKTLPALKGSKRKRRITTESDWSQYHGSNKTLQALVAANDDPARFRREILYLCKTASEMNYLEHREIFRCDAIISPDYFNEYIICRISAKHLKNLHIN